MADETPRKGSFSALVGHTNGLTKPASLAAAAVTAKPGGAGGSKKLVIKNFRGGCGAGGRAGGALGRRPALRGRPVGAGRAGRGGTGALGGAAWSPPPLAPALRRRGPQASGRSGAPALASSQLGAVSGNFQC